MRCRHEDHPDGIYRAYGTGGPYLRGSGRGDLYVNVEVEVPKRLTEKQKALQQKYGRDRERYSQELQKLYDEGLFDGISGISDMQAFLKGEK